LCTDDPCRSSTKLDARAAHCSEDIKGEAQVLQILYQLHPLGRRSCYARNSCPNGGGALAAGLDSRRRMPHKMSAYLGKRGDAGGKVALRAKVRLDVRGRFTVTLHAVGDCRSMCGSTVVTSGRSVPTITDQGRAIVAICTAVRRAVEGSKPVSMGRGVALRRDGRRRAFAICVEKRADPIISWREALLLLLVRVVEGLIKGMCPSSPRLLPLLEGTLLMPHRRRSQTATSLGDATCSW
jgi:hypothetical protein